MEQTARPATEEDLKLLFRSLQSSRDRDRMDRFALERAIAEQEKE